MHTHSIEDFRHAHVYLGEAHARNERKTWTVIAICTAMMVAVALRLEDRWHTVVDLTNQLIRGHRDHGKGALPLICVWITPVLLQSCQAEGRAILHRDGIGLLSARASDGSPLEEAIHRHDAATLGIGISERGKPRDALCLSIDRPAPTSRVAAPMRDQAPLEQVKRALPSLVVLPDDEEFLARGSVVTARDIAQSAIADMTIASRRGPEL